MPLVSWDILFAIYCTIILMHTNILYVIHTYSHTYICTYACIKYNVLKMAPGDVSLFPSKLCAPLLPGNSEASLFLYHHNLQ